MTHPSRPTDHGVSRRAPGADRLARATRAVLAAMIPFALAAAAFPGARAAEEPASDITMTAEAMLGGKVRPGEWAAVRVHVENDGPTMEGELRIASAEAGASTYGVTVQLAPGARQDHILYGKPGFFGSRLRITLMSGDSVVASHDAPVEVATFEAFGVYVVAERPERLITDIRDSVASRGGPPPDVVAIRPEDLPSRVEAWAVVDRLVWQDVPTTSLAEEQLDALRTWVTLGGDLVILGGSTGTTSLEAFPDELLPYRPERAVDVPVADLEGLLGSQPAGATSLPALAGQLQRGTALARSNGDAIAAHMAYGQGSVSLIGIDPATPWLAGSPAAAGLWGRAVPSGVPMSGPLAQDDGFLLAALSNLPSVEPPRMDHLMLLFAGYVVLLGPVNYAVLRRLDRREWAWVTMPALIVVFTVAAFLLGVLLKGTTVVVNELAVVRGAAGTDRGVADVYVGIFSPSRASFDVRLAGGALISEPIVDQQDPDERPLDVLLGDPARLRGFRVGFGALRGFRAETAVAAPRMEADLQLAVDRLHGSLTNTSDVALDHVSIVYGDAVQVLGGMAPGDTRAIDVPAADPAASGQTLAARLLGGPGPGDAEGSRTLLSRHAVLQHLSGGWESDPELASDGLDVLDVSRPVILAWRSGGALDIDVGTAAERVGDTLYVLPARAAASGPVAFSGSTVGHAVLEVDAVEGWKEPLGFYLGRGTMAVDYRPAGLEGAFDVTGLAVRLSWDRQAPEMAGDDLVPAVEQPDQEDPVGSDAPNAPPIDGEGLPHVQLFDRVDGVWVEFEPLRASRTYRVVDPTRYVDASGSFLVRFVSRGQEATYFWLDTRLEGITR
jgi:hypothetical protein